MAYGIQILNDRDEILIDSDFEHFHFAGKATYTGMTNVPPILSGNNTAHSTTSGQGMSASQVNGDIFKYTLYANAASDSPAPMCFIKPSSTGAGAPSCGIILTQRSGTNWIIWVLQTRGYAAPAIYCFLPLRRMAPSLSNPPVADPYSLVTYSATGVRTYDARIRPLKVIATGGITSPSIARSGGKSNGWNPVFTPDNVVNSAFSASGVPPASDLMFYCPSISHSCQEHSEEHSGDGFQTQGYNSYFYAWGRYDLWWCFYRGTFRLIDNATMQSRYDIYASGHVWKSQEDSTSIFGVLAVVALSFLTFGASLVVVAAAVATAAISASFTNAGVISGTYYPYKNSSRNASQTNNYIISRASFYD